MDTWILPERELKVRYVEDGVVSVDHEHFIFAIDQHHVPEKRKEENDAPGQAWGKLRIGGVTGMWTL